MAIIEYTYPTDYVGTNGTLIEGTAENDSITGHPWFPVTVKGYAGDDTIESGGVSVGRNSIDGGDGDDLIKFQATNPYTALGTVALGGKGDDTIICNSVANAYNLYNSNGHSLSGGVGDDYISLEGTARYNVIYAEGDGNDTIAVADEGTGGITLTLSDTYSTVTSGDDMLVKVGEGSILFVGGVDETVTITGGTTNPTDNSTPQETDNGTSEKDDGDEGQNEEGVTVSGNTINLDNNFDGDMLLSNYSEYNNIKVINAQSSSDNKILVGNSNSNSIVGGNGRNSLWGGASGNNTLTGGSSRDQFWYGGNGNDVVTNFSAGNGTNNDVVVLFDGALSGISRNSSSLTFNMSNSRSLNLKTTSSAETIIQYSTDGNNIFGAKIGASNTKSLNYDSSVNYFQLNGGGTLNVTGSGENNVWLDGSQGQSFSGITDIKVTGNSRNIIVGNGENNSITGGSGSSSLWGGSGNSTDILTGGSGAEMFFYGKNDGADIINNASSSDIINLYDISLSDFVTADISGNTFSFTFNTGNSLQITSSENLSATFNLADSSWKYDHSSRSWQNA